MNSSDKIFLLRPYYSIILIEFLRLCWIIYWHWRLSHFKSKVHNWNVFTNWSIARITFEFKIENSNWRNVLLVNASVLIKYSCVLIIIVFNGFYRINILIVSFTNTSINNLLLDLNLMLERHFINHNTYVVWLFYFMYFGNNKSSKLLLSKQYIALMLLFNLTSAFTLSYLLWEISVLRYIVNYCCVYFYFKFLLVSRIVLWVI